MNCIGILGGGQLGRMIAIAAHELGMIPHVFTDSESSPAAQVTRNYTIADYYDQAALLHFAESVNVITFEFESIPLKAVEILSKNSLISPNSNALKIAQNRILEKKFLRENDIKTAEYIEIHKKDELDKIKLPAILKTAEQCYDGKGQILLKTGREIEKLAKFKFPAVAESIVKFDKEISIVVARNKSGIVNFPISRNIHQDGILLTSEVPAKISRKIEEIAISIAFDIAKKLDIIGLLAVEFFLVDDELLVNEIAPRPHNSCHYSMDATDISQFHALCLAITGHRVKQPHLLHECKMHNLLGADVKQWLGYSHKEKHKVYIYNKGDIRAKRKMGHVNVIQNG